MLADGGGGPAYVTGGEQVAQCTAKDGGPPRDPVLAPPLVLRLGTGQQVSCAQ